MTNISINYFFFHSTLKSGQRCSTVVCVVILMFQWIGASLFSITCAMRTLNHAWDQVGRLSWLAPHRTLSMLDYVFSGTRSLQGKDTLTSNALFLLDEPHTAYMLLFFDVYLAFEGMFLLVPSAPVS